MAGAFDQFRIRRMAEKDLDALLAIEQYSFPTPWKRSMYESDIDANRHARFFVIETKDQHELVGYIGSWFIYDEAHIGTIATKQEFRGQRVAEQLIAYTAFQGIQEGIAYIVLEVRVSNAPAIRLYERLGFTQVGLRKRYYTDTQEDALLMTCRDMEGMARRLDIEEVPDEL
ncbi:ribosomal protein S18-alanine N-acetyltransferase [bacterium]|nr:ribosomal protein S18-alanine N-acetyltransferase [bacterium]